MEVKQLQEFLQDYYKNQSTIKDTWGVVCRDVLREHQEEYLRMPVEDAIPRMISAKNLKERRNYISCENLGVHVAVGDICYIDYGDAYLLEIGYQHFGLIIALFHNKAFVVPMSGNHNAYLQAYSKDNPDGKQHLMRLGKIKGMNKESVLFMNDAKWINSARIIDVKAHLDKRSQLFKEIKERIKQCLD